jgi:hypothetical protein
VAQRKTAAGDNPTADAREAQRFDGSLSMKATRVDQAMPGETAETGLLQMTNPESRFFSASSN